MQVDQKIFLGGKRSSPEACVCSEKNKSTYLVQSGKLQTAKIKSVLTSVPIVSADIDYN